MTVALTYTTGPAEYMAHYRAVDPTALQRFRNQLVGGRLLWLVVSGAALLAAMRAGMELLAVAFAILAVGQVCQALLFRRHFEHQVLGSVANMPPREVSLLVDDAGLHETVEGVESFAPWHTVKSWVEIDNVVLLRLGAGTWSIIPRTAFLAASSTAYEEFIRLLAAKSVPTAAEVSKHAQAAVATSAQAQHR